MKAMYLPCHLCLFACVFPTSLLGQVTISDMKDPGIQCDYLVVAPAAFLSPAVRLAEHRNSYDRDEVEKGAVIALETVYEQFPAGDSLREWEVLWTALKWAYENWTEPFTFLLLLGDDSLAYDPADSSFESLGPMPAFVTRVTESGNRIEFHHSDDYYSSLQVTLDQVDASQTWSSPIIPARIPCETAAQCNAYVDKVIDFDTNGAAGPWRNRITLMADDAFMDTVPDPIWQSTAHLESAERIAEQFSDGYFVNKLYLSSFGKNENGVHLAAQRVYFDAVNQGALLSVYFGHGHANMLTDESLLVAIDVDSFHNESQPTVFLSFCCDNGLFNEPLERSMCKQYLFRPSGGCLGYVASAGLSYSRPNEALASSFFAVRDSDSTFVPAKCLHLAKQIEMNPGNLTYHFLGDPGLVLSAPRVSVTLEPSGESSIFCSVADQPSFAGSFRYILTRTDSVVCLDDPQMSYLLDTILFDSTGDFSSRFEVGVPAELEGQTWKLTLYAWNSSAEGRIDTLLDRTLMRLAGGTGGPTGGLSATIRGPLLTVSVPPRVTQAPVTVAIHDLSGRCHKRVCFPPGGRTLTVDLGEGEPARGAYVVIIKTGQLSRTLRYVTASR
jgi:hypothetical protein